MNRKQRFVASHFRGLIVTLLSVTLVVLAMGCGDSGQDAKPVGNVGKPISENALKGPIQGSIPDDPHQQAEVGVRYVAFGMMLYYSHVGCLPSEEVGIDALLEPPHKVEGSDAWAGPYCEASVVQEDPWGHPYHYRLDESLPLTFEVWSTGPDGVDSDDDILASRDGKLPSLEEFKSGLAALKRSSRSSGSSDSEGAGPAAIPGGANSPE